MSFGHFSLLFRKKVEGTEKDPKTPVVWSKINHRTSLYLNLGQLSFRRLHNFVLCSSLGIGGSILFSYSITSKLLRILYCGTKRILTSVSTIFQSVCLVYKSFLLNLLYREFCQIFLLLPVYSVSFRYAFNRFMYIEIKSLTSVISTIP